MSRSLASAPCPSEDPTGESCRATCRTVPCSLPRGPRIVAQAIRHRELGSVMRSRQHGLLRLVTSVVLLSAAVSCTGEDSPEPEPSPTPQPTPTVYAGEAPPGLAAQPLRYLHDPAQPGQDILSDPLGVRIHSVGDAFLISSNSEERHLLQRSEEHTSELQSRENLVCRLL